MSEAGYDGERCEGCASFTPSCEYKGGPKADSSACEDFKPSLQCRPVRALERIADSLGRLDRVGITTWEGED